jgi:hypothetical protein
MNLDKKDVSQAIYDLSTILKNLKSIDDTKEKMDEYIGKPFYDGCNEAIEKWNKHNEECIITLLPSLEKIINSIK